MNPIKFYIYPRININEIDSPNPYVFNFEKSLKGGYYLVNNYYNKLGVLDFFKNIFKTDLFFFNWIEELPSKRYGRLQTILFLFFIYFVKILNRRIVWIMHNLYTHNKSKHEKWSRMVFKLMLKYSDLIITHSRGGVTFVKEKYPKQERKVIYLIHPVLDNLFLPQSREKIEYDFFIWGTIYPYKGIAEFLNFATSRKEFERFKILIAGICPDKEYERQIQSYVSQTVYFRGNYYELDEISRMAHKSRFVLFTYNSDSVLSSGSLMDTIRMGVHIIGPRKGAFEDLEKFPFIHTYRNYDEILHIYQQVNSSNLRINKQFISFCRENSWKRFGDNLDKELKELFPIS